MKKTTIKTALLLVATCVSLYCGATTRTVNNNVTLPVNPGQYTSIAAAIAAASRGDTILVAGSAITYDPSGFTINKKIILLGAGYNPDIQNPKPSVIGGTVTLNTGSDTSVIIGFKFTSLLGNYPYASTTISNITIRRNWFNGVTYGIDGATYISCYAVNWLIAENMFYANAITLPSTNGCVIKNNVFYAGAGVGIYGYGDIIDHNLFLDGSHTTPLKTTGLQPAIVANNTNILNNIFYNMLPTDTSAGATSVNNTFLNNITYCGITLPAMPYHTNVGSGNINNTNPQLTTLFSSTANPYLDFKLDNLRPQSGSPVINAGFDATNIGPTGGVYPIYLSTNTYLTGEPPIPEIKSINYISSSAVNVGGNIRILVTAKKIN